MIHSQLFEFITNQHNCDQIHGHSGTVSVLHLVSCKTYHSPSHDSSQIFKWFKYNLRWHVTACQYLWTQNEEKSQGVRNETLLLINVSQQSWIRTTTPGTDETKARKHRVLQSRAQTSAWPRGCVGASESCAWTNAVTKRGPEIWVPQKHLCRSLPLNEHL